MITKKSEELRKLRLFYDEKEYEILTADESPDFILEDDTGNRFGVEVTDYYQDGQTGGRYYNLPNYIEKIISGEYIDKDDINKLERIEVFIPDHPELPQGVPAIRRLNYTTIEKVEVLKDIIGRKNLLHNSYTQKVSTVDLLVYDHGDLSNISTRHEIFPYLYMQSISGRKISLFRNVVIICEYPEGGLNRFIVQQRQ